MESPLSHLSMENLGSVADAPPLFTELLELYRYEDGYQVGQKFGKGLCHEQSSEKKVIHLKP